MTSYSFSDQPTKEDVFSRVNFAERIATVIGKRSDPSSLTIGLYGVWGSGKSSVLNIVKDYLDKNYKETTVLLMFNPWRFETEDQLLSFYFRELASTIGVSLVRRRQKIGNLIKAIGAKLPTVSVKLGSTPQEFGSLDVDVGSVVHEFGKQLSEVSIEDLKTRIGSLLQEEQIKVVVFLDDIDRLDSKELYAVFRLVKLTSDFNYTTFVLAFDPGRVARAIGARFGATEYDDGKDFIEKIIQLPIDLPKIPVHKLQSYTIELLKQVIFDAVVYVSDERWTEFFQHFSTAFQFCLTTPRMARRYANAVAFVLPILESELDVVDLMLIEGVRVFYPVVYEIIRETRGFQESLSPAINQIRGSLEDRLMEALKAQNEVLSKAEVHALAHLIGVLFPRNISDQHNAINKRIGSNYYFDRYFVYAIPDGDVPDAEINAIVTLCYSANGKADAARRISSLATDTSVITLLTKLRQTLDSFDADTAFQLAEAFSATGDRFLYKDSDGAIFLNARALLIDLISKVDADKRRELAEALLKEESALPLVLGTLAYLGAQELGKPNEERVLTGSLHYLGDLVVGTCKRLLNNDLLYRPRTNFTDEIYFAWRVWGDPQEIATYVESGFSSWPNTGFEFLRTFIGNVPDVYLDNTYAIELSKWLDLDKLLALVDAKYPIENEDLSALWTSLAYKKHDFTDKEIAIKFRVLCARRRPN